MKYLLKISNKEGKIREETIEAETRQKAIDKLRSQGFLVISIKEAGEGKKIFSYKKLSLIGSVSTLSKVLFTKHLSLMIKAGLTINESFGILADQTQNRRFKNIISKIKKSIEEGNSLADSFAKHPRVFGPLFVNVVKAGEQGGSLEESLEYLALQMRKDYDLRKKVKTASVYPSIVFISVLGLGGVLAVFVLPRLTKLFQSFDLELPFLTRVLIAISNFLVSYGWQTLIVAIIAVVLFKIISKREAIKPFFHRLLLKIPIIGRMSKNFNSARFTRTLGTLVKGGVPIMESLEITSATLDNYMYRQAVKRAMKDVGKGINLTIALGKEKKLFPVVLSRMIGVGERSGKLEETLFYLADFYDQEIDSSTKSLSDTLEPILLIIIGLIVGLVAVSIIMPIYQLTGAIGR